MTADEKKVHKLLKQCYKGVFGVTVTVRPDDEMDCLVVRSKAEPYRDMGYLEYLPKEDVWWVARAVFFSDPSVGIFEAYEPGDEQKLGPYDMVEYLLKAEFDWRLGEAMEGAAATLWEDY